MKCGIIGLPNVGKSKLFNCLSNNKIVKSDNFPFCTIKPNINIIEVPDKRLYYLNNILNSKKIIPSTIKIVDIAGLVKGASKGKGLGNQFLSNIRETNVIIHVLRCFEDDNIIHIEDNINPNRDKDIVNIELQIKDLELIEKEINILNKQKTTDQNIVKKEILKKAKILLNNGKNLNEINSDEIIFNYNQINYLKSINLLTLKPMLYLCNVNSNKKNQYIKNEIFFHKKNFLIIDLEEESHEKNKLNQKLYITNSKINQLINNLYKLLDLQTFFTVSKKEIRSWSIKKNSKAIKAASIIHSDFEKGFIRAEVIHYNDFIELKSKQKIKDNGKIYVEGKDYIIHDGDIIKILFNL